MIEFKDVQIKYGDFVAVDKLSLCINQGEFFTFLGPSGCGKTTTLRALVGFNNPSRGNIFVGGRVINDVPIEKRKIGIVFQSYALFPSMSVYENIAYGLKVQKVDKVEIKRRVHEVAEKIELTSDKLQNNISELSGGQQQRVALARAIILEPEILCLDEPLSNLDAKLRVGLRDELKRLQKNLGITTLYVTHDQDEALTLSDRIAVFRNGCIEQVGTPFEIYNSSATEFVCDFIGANNRLGPKVLAQINQQVGTALDTGKQGFIRNERVHSNPTLPYDVVLEGKLVETFFSGQTMKYCLDVLGEEIFSLAHNDGRPFCSIGDTMALYLNSVDVKQY